MINQAGQSAIEARLERAAEVMGDLTAPVMAEYYRRFPEARASFFHHAPHGPDRLEAEMVGNTLYYVMTWFESPTEARIYFDTSVPHHRVALDVPPDWFRGLIEALIDVIEAGVPAIDAAEQQAWEEVRAALVGLVERNRFI
ncbi:MAG: hypothetical protein U9R07_13825 [Pseudomonadota bacterium]|nr:hypothetical protein [Pseudomonadota bacterium]